jgi:hypothetical protein
MVWDPGPGFQVANEDPVYFDEFLDNDTWFQSWHVGFMNNTNFILGFERSSFDFEGQKAPDYDINNATTLVLYTYAENELDRREIRTFQETDIYSTRLAYVNNQSRLYLTVENTLCIYNIDEKPPELIDSVVSHDLKNVHVYLDHSGAAHQAALQIGALPLSDSILHEIGEDEMYYFYDKYGEYPRGTDKIFYYYWKEGAYSLDTIPLPKGLEASFANPPPMISVDRDGKVYIALILTPESATYDLSGNQFGSHLYLISKEQDKWQFQFIDEK